MSYWKSSLASLILPLLAAGTAGAADIEAVGDIESGGRLVSTVATGTPPLAVSSQTAVTNFNADMIDGLHASDLALADHSHGSASEINYSCAVVGGCFSGDAGGWPVTITQPGSYYLGGHLYAYNDTSLHIIEVSASNVTIDLNGFSIYSNNDCSSGTCTLTGEGSGIYVTADAHKNLTVRNGTITAMPGHGLMCRYQCRVVDVTATHNGNGVSVFSGHGTMTRVHAHYNGIYGISNAAGSISDSVASYNGIGFWVGEGVARGCSAYYNRGDGFRTWDSLVVDSSSARNGGYGIAVHAGYASVINGNVFKANTLGNISGTAVELGPNYCGLGALCSP